MKSISRCILCIGLFSLTPQSAMAQGLKDHFFQSIGYTAFLDVFRLPSFSNTTGGFNEADALEGISLSTYIYQPRINLINLGDDASIDIHAIPSLAFSFSQTESSEKKYIGMISLPVLAGISFGNVSTYDAKKNAGFGLAVGYEYLNGGLIKVSDEGSGKVKTSVFEPVVQLAFRYWSKMNKAKEISLLAGVGSKGNADIENGTAALIGNAHGSAHIRLTWATYINY